MFNYLVFITDFILLSGLLLKSMLPIQTHPLVLFLLNTFTFAQQSRSLMMTKMTGQRFECANSTCFPFHSSTVPTILGCQTACLLNDQCQALSFHTPSRTCALFTYAASPAGGMLWDADTITIVAIANTGTSWK